MSNYKKGIYFYRAEDLLTTSKLRLKDANGKMLRTNGLYGFRYKLSAIILILQNKADLIVWKK